jgi:hypothetical protein
MNLGKPVRYLFFAIYRRQVQTGRTGNPVILPAVVVTILLSLNILVIIQVLMSTGMTIPILNAIPELSRLLGYACYLTVGALVWLSLVRNRDFEALETEFAGASEQQNKARTAALYLYVGISICLPLALRAILPDARIH